MACSIHIVWEYYRFSFVKFEIPKDQSMILRYSPTESAASLVAKMHQMDLIKSEWAALAFIRLYGLATQLKAGTYLIESKMTAAALLKQMVRGKVLTLSFQIIPGSNFYQIHDLLRHSPYLDYKKSDWEVLKDEGVNPEGLLLADTYLYDADSSAKMLIKRAHYALIDVLSKAWHERSEGLPYHKPYELLVAASILQKEAALASEQHLISGVIVNRLHKRMPLQMDPTVIYGLNDQYQGRLRKRDLADDSPYNTYRHRGLPPGPIAMVSKAAIDAAAHPTVSDYLYFVAKGDGSHQFSVDYKDQRQAVAKYLLRLDAR